MDGIPVMARAQLQSCRIWGRGLGAGERRRLCEQSLTLRDELLRLPLALPVEDVPHLLCQRVTLRSERLDRCSADSRRVSLALMPFVEATITEWSKAP